MAIYKIGKQEVEAFQWDGKKTDIDIEGAKKIGSASNGTLQLLLPDNIYANPGDYIVSWEGAGQSVFKKEAFEAAFTEVPPLAPAPAPAPPPPSLPVTEPMPVEPVASTS